MSIGQADRAVLVFMLAVVSALVYFFVSDRIDANNRREAFCRAEHQEQVDWRKQEVSDYKRFKRRDYARFFQDPDNRLARELTRNTRHKLHGQFSNRRIVATCPQHDWPEDERTWPEELRTKRTGV